MGDTCEELKYPGWQKPLQEVILEFDREKIEKKALNAEAVIVRRLRELRESPETKDEREAIRYGLSLLKSIKCEGLGYPDVP